MVTLVVLEGVVVAILAFLVVGLLQSHAEILRRLHQLDGHRLPDADPAGLVPGRSGGAPASDLVGRTPAGEAIAIGVVGADYPTLLAFLSSGCVSCGGFWDAFARPKRLGLPAGTRLVAVTRDADSESVSLIGKVAPPDLTVVLSSEAWEDYAVPGSPYFVLVDGPAGVVVGEGTGTAWSQVQSLMDQALADRAAAGAFSGGAFSADPAQGAPYVGAAGGGRAGTSTGAGGPGIGDPARARRSDRGRMAIDDSELLAAGIGPGHPSLHAPPNGAAAAAGPTATDPGATEGVTAAPGNEDLDP